MKLLTRKLEDDHNIFFYSCLHNGSQLSSKKGFETMVNMMLSAYDGCRNNYGASGGDMIEAIMADDKRYSPEKLTEPMPLAQAKDVIIMHKPIKHLLLYWLLGNHEYTLWRFGNLSELIASELGVPYGTYTAKMCIRDYNDKQMYKIYHTHGRKSITSTADDPVRRQANYKLILKRHLKDMAGDCAVMIKGHTHKLLVCEPAKKLYLVDDGKKIKQAYTHWGQTENYIHEDYRWYGNSGSFLKLFGDGFSGYAEMAEYPPMELGFLILEIRDKQIIGLKPYYINI